MLETIATLRRTQRAEAAILATVDRLVVRRSSCLSGRVPISGAKNSALKLIAATLLAPGTHRLDNIPEVTDVATMVAIVSAMGAKVQRDGEGALVIEMPDELRPEAPYELVEKIRASFVVLGPLLARCGRAKVALPGGDDFGDRPVDYHLRAFSELGASFTTAHGEVLGRSDGLVGARVVLEYPSHTTTDNVLMAAVLAKGRTVIDNAAREPEVADLAAMLTKMGASISGAGTSRIEIEGVERLVPVRHAAIPDRVEAATFLAAVGLAGGEVVLDGARGEHMELLLDKVRAIGIEVAAVDGGLVASSGRRLRAIDVSTLPYPGVATDYKPFLVTLLSVASGVSIVSENLYAGGRFRYVEELRRLGADVRTEGTHAVIRGVRRLSGAPVRASDLRAGAALCLAGLAADGTTIVSGLRHVERGYEHFAAKLSAIGADVEVA
jgi:UDP-N-acetylglucosamine 1-carboxyvinyltransferase